MSLDESTSCNWSIYGGDVRRSDGDVDEDWCIGDEVSTIANTEETDLPIDWRIDGDDADLEGVLLFDATNYENGIQCDNVNGGQVPASVSAVSAPLTVTFHIHIQVVIFELLHQKFQLINVESNYLMGI